MVDAPLLAELFRAMDAENPRAGGDGPFADDLAAWMDLDGGRHLTWLAEGDDGVIGMIWLALIPRVPRPYLRDRWSGDVQTFWIRPHHRGRGLGRRMLDAALLEADRRGLERVVVHSSSGAVALYERAGFEHDPLVLSATPSRREMTPT